MTETQTTTELDFSKIGMTEGQLKKLSERPSLVTAATKTAMKNAATKAARKKPSKASKAKK